MVNGTSEENGSTACSVCDARLAPDAMRCGVCGAEVGAAIPTGSRPTEEPTIIRVPTAAAMVSAGPVSAGPVSAGPVSASAVSASAVSASAMSATSSGIQFVPIAEPEPVTQIAPPPAPVLPPAPLPAPEPEPEPEPETARPEEIALPEQTTLVDETPAETAPISGLPRRAPRPSDIDEDELKEAFLRSWEAPPAEPLVPATPGFAPTYPSYPEARLGEPEPTEPPRPVEPPDPANPPDPAEPPEPAKPPTPAPPAPPSPFPSPTPPPGRPVPRPGPTPDPVPPVPPAPPVPPVPGPMPVPPPVVPPPPTIRTRPSVHQGGRYTELETEPITGLATASRSGSVHSGPGTSGSLSGHLRVRGEVSERRRLRKARTRKVLGFVIGIGLFLGGIAWTVYVLAYDFIMSIFRTFSEFAG